jgi:NRPS condensation-like uncharacterized protein
MKHEQDNPAECVGTAKLTVRLQNDDIAFAKAYAREHVLTVNELIARYLRRMRELVKYEPSEEVKAMTGLIPPSGDAKAEYRKYQMRKHA